MNQEFVLFDEPFPIKKKVPCHIQMKSIDKKLPPVGVLEGGDTWVRWYWNRKAKLEGERRKK